MDATITHTVSGTRITLPSYYAGNDVWEVAVMPTRTREWTYATSSSDVDLNRATGSVMAIDSGHPHVLKVGPAPPKKWKFTDGPYAVPIALRMSFFSESASRSAFTAAADYLKIRSSTWAARRCGRPRWRPYSSRRSVWRTSP